MKFKTKNMAFGIIRARNLKIGDMGEVERHNARGYEREEEYPKNIQIEKGDLNKFYYASDGGGRSSERRGRLQKEIEQRLEENQVKGIKKNSNIAIEFVCTINDKRVWHSENGEFDSLKFDRFCDDTRKWLEDRHGEGSVVAHYQHLDESNPHIHFIVLPLESKEIKWKNKNGSGVKKETHIETRKYTGGKEKLRALQDDWYAHLCKTYGDGIDGKPSKLGVPIYRGTLVEHQKKQYSLHTNHEIAILKGKLSKANTEYELKEIEAQIALKEAQLLAIDMELKQIEEEKKRDRNIWDKKGTRDNEVIFHTEEPEEEPERKRGIRR
jgi:hypothetical protein